jgi:hypothetical protein
MANVAISGDTSGAITLASPAVAGTNTATLPAATGTVMVSGNMPSVYAYQSGGNDLSISTSTTTKVLFNTEIWDTANCFASSAFTPNVAGYYQINFIGQTHQFVSGRAQCWAYKSGSAYLYSELNFNSATTLYPTYAINGLIYCNGTTDYIEIYVRQEAGSTQPLYSGGAGGNSNATIFQANLVRTA